MNYQKIKPQWGQGFYFMFYGPLIGLGILLSIIFVGGLINADLSDLSNIDDIIGGAIFFCLISLLVAYLVGAIPAFITGLISGIGENKTEEIIFSVASGGASCFLVSDFFVDDIYFILAACALGSISGLLCVLLKYKKLTRLG